MLMSCMYVLCLGERGLASTARLFPSTDFLTPSTGNHNHLLSDACCRCLSVLYAAIVVVQSSAILPPTGLVYVYLVLLFCAKMTPCSLMNVLGDKCSGYCVCLNTAMNTSLSPRLTASQPQWHSCIHCGNCGLENRCFENEKQ